MLISEIDLVLQPDGLAQEQLLLLVLPLLFLLLSELSVVEELPEMMLFLPLEEFEFAALILAFAFVFVDHGRRRADRVRVDVTIGRPRKPVVTLVKDGGRRGGDWGRRTEDERSCRIHDVHQREAKMARSGNGARVVIRIRRERWS